MVTKFPNKIPVSICLQISLCNTFDLNASQPSKGIQTNTSEKKAENSRTIAKLSFHWFSNIWHSRYWFSEDLITIRHEFSILRRQNWVVLSPPFWLLMSCVSPAIQSARLGCNRSSYQPTAMVVDQTCNHRDYFAGFMHPLKLFLI